MLSYHSPVIRRSDWLRPRLRAICIYLVLVSYTAEVTLRHSVDCRMGGKLTSVTPLQKYRYIRREPYSYTRCIAAFGRWKKHAQNVQRLEEKKMHKKSQHREENMMRKKEDPRKPYNRPIWWLKNSSPCQPALWAYYRHTVAVDVSHKSSSTAQNSTVHLSTPQPIPSYPISSHPTLSNPAQPSGTSSSAATETTWDTSILQSLPYHKTRNKTQNEARDSRTHTRTNSHEPKKKIPKKNPKTNPETKPNIKPKTPNPTPNPKTNPKRT